MILLFALACTRSPPVEVSGRLVASHELAITIRTNQAVCLYDRTPLPTKAGWGTPEVGTAGGDVGPYSVSEFAYQVLVHDDCRVHIQLGQGTILSSERGWSTLERCVPAGTTVERRVRLTDPLWRYWLEGFYSYKRPFALQPYPEIAVDVEYRLPHENELVIHEEITLTTGERANLFLGVKKPYLDSHWATSAPIPVPDLPMLSKDKPCTPSPEWIP